MNKKISWFTLVACVVTSLSLSVFALSEDDVSIDVLAVSPRSILGDDTGFLDRRSTGLSVVGVGETCFLMANVPEAMGAPEWFDWTFTQMPSGSQSVFQVANQKKTAFSPDKEGWFEVQLSFVLPGSDVIMAQKLRILAASYVGVGGMNNDSPKFPECGVCHSSVVTEWKETRHANVLKRHLNGERSNQYEPKCLECHTLGFDKNLQAPDNGFHVALNQAGVAPQEIANLVNEAYELNHDSNTGNNVAYYETLLPSLRARANVQCENCHGPGSQHFGNPAQIGKAWDARICAQCHDSQGHDNYPYPFDSSAHKTLPTMFQDYPSLLQSSCAKCHSAEGFVRLAIHGDTTSAPETTDPHAVSCVACHDPHDKTLPNQLRRMGDVTLDSGYEFKEAGKGSLCVLCHQSRVSGNLETFIQNDTVGPHFGPQADVLLGVNAWTFGDDTMDRVSVHKVVLQDTCVTCHMARIPENGWSVEEGILAGGHSFKIANPRNLDTTADDVSNYKNACLPCHLTITSVDRVMQSGQDYDGNGRVEGIQTEIRGLLMRIATRLQDRYPTITIGDDFNLVIPSTLFNQFSFSEKAVIYNFRLFVRDGSFGVHNGRFTVEILQKSYAALTLRSLKLDYPDAYMIGTSSINAWSEYNDSFE